MILRWNCLLSPTTQPLHPLYIIIYSCISSWVYSCMWGLSHTCAERPNWRAWCVDGITWGMKLHSLFKALDITDIRLLHSAKPPQQDSSTCLCLSEEVSQASLGHSGCQEWHGIVCFSCVWTLGFTMTKHQPLSIGLQSSIEPRMVFWSALCCSNVIRACNSRVTLANVTPITWVALCFMRLHYQHQPCRARALTPIRALTVLTVCLHFWLACSTGGNGGWVVI